MRFGEFDELYPDSHAPLHRAFSQLQESLHNFSPETRPATWRILVTQAHICQALILTRGGFSADDTEAEASSFAPWLSFPPQDRELFDWRCMPNDSARAEALEDPFKVAEDYLHLHLKGVFAELST